MGQLLYSMFARSKYGGDCAAIELYVFALLSNCECKNTKKNKILTKKKKKV